MSSFSVIISFLQFFRSIRKNINSNSPYLGTNSRKIEFVSELCLDLQHASDGCSDEKSAGILRARSAGRRNGRRQDDAVRNSCQHERTEARDRQLSHAHGKRGFYWRFASRSRSFGKFIFFIKYLMRLIVFFF